MINLSVNVNKVATLRNARGGGVPNVSKAALTCIKAGSQGITVHPREDQRHIKQEDVFELSKLTTAQKVEYNIEGDPRPELLNLVLKIVPDQFTLVPVEEGEITSHHGWDIDKNREKLTPVIKLCKEKGIRISLFMDAIPQNMVKAAEIGADRIELYTGPYACAKTENEIKKEFSLIKESHDAALKAGLELNAGHDLDIDNIPMLLELKGIKEASIGHAIISYALYVGLEKAVKNFRKACGQREDIK
ncbi:MAG: pyridoxine 5'-phosphate synthase [Deltaproteobacteria bacterium]|nr:pyridoxine 5'-phosphate synthase [Deltaproteobacteria bacterium]